MAKLVNHTSLTVDGLVDVGEWFVAEGDHDRVGVEQLTASAALLTGRPTYEGFLGFWPNESGPWADVINPMPKYVASRTVSGPLEWNATALTGDAVDTVARVKDEVDGEIFLTGCGELARTLIEAGLVDELRFWVHPSIGGPGTRPYEGKVVPMRLLEARGFDSGVTLLRYEPTVNRSG